MVNFFTPKSGPVLAPLVAASIEPPKTNKSLYFNDLRQAQ